MKDLTQDKYISVDFSKIQGWQNIDKGLLAATQVNDSVEISEAKQAELTNCRKQCL